MARQLTKPSKTKLIEEGKALLAETDEPLRGQYERLLGEFRRMLAESEREKSQLLEQLHATGRKVEEVQSALKAARDAGCAKDNPRATRPVSPRGVDDSRRGRRHRTVTAWPRSLWVMAFSAAIVICFQVSH